jgi:NADPH:quinone reductase-like Zn-dependent oxidoreductase
VAEAAKNGMVSTGFDSLFDLLEQRKIKPPMAQRFPIAEARHAHELLGKGGVTGKIVLVCNGAWLESGAA